MTPQQKTRMEGLYLSSDTATFDDLKAAIGSEILVLKSIEEAWFFLHVFRVIQRNCPDQTGDDINIILGEALRKELNLFARGASMIHNFFTWFEKSQPKS